MTKGVMNRDAMRREVFEGLAWGGAVVVMAVAATLARKLGFIDADTVKRLVIGANGLMIAWYGNRMPKVIVPNAHARQARRVAGWAMVLSGLIYAGLWALAPVPVAASWGTFAIVAGIAATFGYCLSLRPRARAV